MAKNDDREAPPRLVALANAHQAAKARETEAREARVRVEEEIAELVGFGEDPGSETFRAEAGAGSTVRIRLKRPENRRFDAAGWPALRRDLPPDARQVVSQTYKLDARAFGALRRQDPGAHAKISRLVTTTPGKVSVEVLALAVASEEDIELADVVRIDRGRGGKEAAS